jgi:hypothetical protein
MWNQLMSILTGTLLLASSTAFAIGGPGRGPAPVEITLSLEEVQDLRFMREEEKLARDVYLTLYERWNAQLFANIAISEQRHMDAMLRQLIRYGIDDPAAGNPIGEFSNPNLQALYDALIAKGLKRRLKAFKVGGFIEESDIRDLASAIERSSVEQIDTVYGNLLCGSRNHLRAFAQKIETLTGKPYVAQVLTQTEVNQIIDAEVETCGR